jgi:hypothetical protein
LSITTPPLSETLADRPARTSPDLARPTDDGQWSTICTTMIQHVTAPALVISTIPVLKL